MEMNMLAKDACAVCSTTCPCLLCTWSTVSVGCEIACIIPAFWNMKNSYSTLCYIMEPTVAKTPIVSYSVNVDTTSLLPNGDAFRSNLRCAEYAKHRCSDHQCIGTFNPSSEYPIGYGLSSHHTTDNAWLFQANQILNSNTQDFHCTNQHVTDPSVWPPRISALLAAAYLPVTTSPGTNNDQHRCSGYHLTGEISSVGKATSQYALSMPTPFLLNYQPSTLEAGIIHLPTAAQNISCCWYLLSPLLTAACLPASNYFSQTSSSADQRLTWPSYPLVEPACAKKAVTILN